MFKQALLAAAVSLSLIGARPAVAGPITTIEFSGTVTNSTPDTSGVCTGCYVPVGTRITGDYYFQNNGINAAQYGGMDFVAGSFSGHADPGVYGVRSGALSIQIALLGDINHSGGDEYMALATGAQHYEGGDWWPEGYEIQLMSSLGGLLTRSVFDVPDISQFDSAEFIFSFNTAGRFGGLEWDAKLDHLALVPEPSALLLLVVPFALFAWCRRSASIAVLGLALMLAGCIGMPGIIVMKNPATGELVQCKGDPWGRGPLDTEDCAKGYDKAGWVRMNK